MLLPHADTDTSPCQRVLIQALASIFLRQRSTGSRASRSVQTALSTPSDSRRSFSMASRASSDRRVSHGWPTREGTKLCGARLIVRIRCLNRLSHPALSGWILSGPHHWRHVAAWNGASGELARAGRALQRSAMWRLPPGAGNDRVQHGREEGAGSIG